MRLLIIHKDNDIPPKVPGPGSKTLRSAHLQSKATGSEFSRDPGVCSTVRLLNLPLIGNDCPAGLGASCQVVEASYKV